LTEQASMLTTNINFNSKRAQLIFIYLRLLPSLSRCPPSPHRYSNAHSISLAHM
jgi:hypothetical protein